MIYFCQQYIVHHLDGIDKSIIEMFSMFINGMYESGITLSLHVCEIIHEIRKLFQ